MRSTIENATVLTMNAGGEVLDPGWIEITDGVLTAVSSRPLDVANSDRRIDGTDKVVLPGIVNAHTHLFQTLIRGVY